MIAPLLPDLARRSDLTVYTQDEPSFPPGTTAVHDHDLGVSWRHGIETVPTLIKVVDGEEVERTVGWSRPDWQRITGIDGLGQELPPSRPGCGSMSVDPDRVDELRVRFDGGRLRSRARRTGGARGRHRGDVRPWLERRAARRPADRGARPAAARGDVPRPGGGRRDGAAGPRRRHGREDRHRCGDGGLSARVPAVGDHRRRSGLQRPVQHPRRARHDDARRAGHRRQWAGDAGHRDELRRERARSGQPGQPHDRTGAAARRPQRRWRASRWRGPRHPREPREALLLLRRATRLAVRHARREPRRGTGSRRDHPVRRRRPALRRRPDLATAGEPGGEPRRVPPHGPHPQARPGLRCDPGPRSRARPGLCRCPVGPRPRSRRARRATPDPRRRARPGRQRHRRGPARRRSPSAPSQSSAPAGSCSPARAAGRACSPRSSAAGPTASSAAKRKGPGVPGRRRHCVATKSAVVARREVQ